MHKAKLLHKLLWRGVQMSFGIYLKFMFRITIIWNAKPPKKEGYLLVANHSNRNDPFMIGVNLRTPINYMANLEGVTGGQEFFSAGIGCFNIKKGRADRQAFTKAINLFKGGYSVGIFPEGDRSWLGETVEFSSAIPSLAKKMNVPVVMARVTGNYLSTPRWNEMPRRGKIFIEFDLISKEQIGEMSKDEVYKTIADYVQNDDFTSELLKDVEFTGKNLAVGIERLLWRCPSCNKEDQLKGVVDSIHCESCNAEFAIDGNQRVNDSKEILSKVGISNVKEWFNWQLNAMKENSNNVEVDTLVSDQGVELIKEISDGQWESLGKGEINLEKEQIIWISKTEKLDIPLDEVLNVVDNFNIYAILNLKNDRYRVVFNNTCSYKWTTALSVIKA